MAAAGPPPPAAGRPPPDHGRPAPDAGRPAPDARPPERGRPRPARRGYLVPGAIALVVLAAIAAVVNFTGLEHRDPSTLSGPDVATYIAQGIQAGVGDHHLPQVACPPSEPVRVGLRFTCQEAASPHAGRHTVDVVVTASSGTFTWHLATGD